MGPALPSVRMEGKVCDTLILTSVRMEGKVCDTLTLTSVRMEGKLRDTYTDTTLCENRRQSLCHTDTALCENGRQTSWHLHRHYPLWEWKAKFVSHWHCPSWLEECSSDANCDRHAHTDTYSGTQTHTVVQNYTNQKGPSTMTLLVSHAQRIARRPTPTACVDPYWVHSWCNESGPLRTGFLNRWLPFFRQ